MKNRIIEEIKKIAGDKIVRVETVNKVNRPPQTGVSFMEPPTKPHKISVSPVMYIDELVKECEEGSRTPAEAAQIVVNAVQRISCVSFEPAEFIDFNKAKEKIIVRIVNAQRNEVLLETLACVRVLDFAIIFSYVIQLEDGVGMINITKEHLKSWGIEIEELRTVALENTVKKNPWLIKDMADMKIPGINTPRGYMYVLTNKSGHFGTSVIFYESLLNHIYHQIGAFYLLPSSVHEWILVPIIKQADPGDLESIVRSVNRDVIEIDDYLSDSVYYFDGKDLTIKK